MLTYMLQVISIEQATYWIILALWAQTMMVRNHVRHLEVKCPFGYTAALWTFKI